MQDMNEAPRPQRDEAPLSVRTKVYVYRLYPTRKQEETLRRCKELYKVKVAPQQTSQVCSGCGVLVPKDLSVRWHSCPTCGTELDRDENAARNILRRYELQRPIYERKKEKPTKKMGRGGKRPTATSSLSGGR